MSNPASNRSDAEHLDVLIVGAGISGIDAAYHLQHFCPGKSFQGTHPPWVATNDYYLEREEFPAIDLDEPELRYS